MSFSPPPKVTSSGSWVRPNTIGSLQSERKRKERKPEVTATASRMRYHVSHLPAPQALYIRLAQGFQQERLVRPVSRCKVHIREPYTSSMSLLCCPTGGLPSPVYTVSPTLTASDFIEASHAFGGTLPTESTGGRSSAAASESADGPQPMRLMESYRQKLGILQVSPLSHSPRQTRRECNTGGLEKMRAAALGPDCQLEGQLAYITEAFYPRGDGYCRDQSTSCFQSVTG